MTMIASAIRELAASDNPAWIAAALFERTIEIWDLKSSEKLYEFPTIFCSGAKNLALAPNGEMLVVGSSRNRGKIAAYEVQSGRIVWERKLTYPSLLQFHSSGQSILCSAKRQSVLRLDVHTGEVLEVIEAIQRCTEGPSGDALLVPTKESDAIRLIARSRSFSIKRKGFAVMDAQFSSDCVCLSESGAWEPRTGGLVRCIRLVDGELQWTYNPGAGAHIVRLHYSPTKNAFFGIQYHFDGNSPRALIRLDSDSGACECVCELSSWEEVFSSALDQLVTSAGEIRDLSTGSVVRKLAFPRKEYRSDLERNLKELFGVAAKSFRTL